MARNVLTDEDIDRLLSQDAAEQLVVADDGRVVPRPVPPPVGEPRRAPESRPAPVIERPTQRWD